MTRFSEAFIFLAGSGARGLGAAAEGLAHRFPLPVELGELPAQDHRSR